MPRKTEHLSTARARAEDPEVITHWFQLLDKVLTEGGIKDMPAQIFNTDETGFVTDPKTSTVLAKKGSKRVNHRGDFRSVLYGFPYWQIFKKKKKKAVF